MNSEIKKKIFEAVEAGELTPGRFVKRTVISYGRVFCERYYFETNDGQAVANEYVLDRLTSKVTERPDQPLWL